MTPAFRVGDRILVNRLSYLLNKPRIRDVVVLKREKFIIKRIAKIKPSADGDIFFVTGDNRRESTDSRHFGWVRKKDIVGRVMFKI